MDRGRYFYNPSPMQGFYGESAEYPQYFPFYHSMQSGETPPNTLQAMPQTWMPSTCTPQASAQVSVSQVSASQAGSSQASQAASSPAGSSSSSPSSPEAADQTGRRAYDRWSNDEEKMLINLWAENLDRINSSQARKAWDDIAKQMNLKFGTRATEKYQKKIKYLVDRYKLAKDWNSKQTGGQLRKSAHFEAIDAVMGCREIVTLGNVKEAGSAASELEEATGSSEQGDCIEKKEERTSRKKTRKREREEENANEDRKMFRAAFTGLETQRNDMNNFVNNFARIQEQQLTTMNALVGALSKFLEKQ